MEFVILYLSVLRYGCCELLNASQCKGLALCCEPGKWFILVFDGKVGVFSALSSPHIHYSRGNEAARFMLTVLKIFATEDCWWSYMVFLFYCMMLMTELVLRLIIYISCSSLHSINVQI